MPNGNAADRFNIVGSIVVALLCLVMYVYFSITLMIIARKTGTPGGWLAWFPPLNLVLMCQIGGVSLAWILATFVPCLNVVAMLVIYAGMARARGKSGATAFLLLVPPINLFLPLYLALGPAISAGASRGGSRACPNCGVPAAFADTFCGSCGQPLAPVQPVAMPVRPASSSAGCVVAMLCVLALFGVTFLGCCGVGGFFLLYDTPYSAPVRDTPELPRRLAGTLTQFPLDTDTASPTKPSAIISQTFRNDAGEKVGGSVQVAQQQLPPGVKPEDLPDLASTMTSATYRAEPTSSPVNVHVLATPDPARTASQITQGVIQSTGGNATGVSVNTPNGQTYTGTRIDTTQNVTFVLVNPTIQICIIIYAPDRSVENVATRLAGNVGNGQGLLDPEFQPYVCALPAIPPPGLTIREIRVFTSADILSQGSGGAMPADAASDEEVQRALAQFEAFVPDQISGVQYVDATGKEWHVLVCDYGQPRRARWVWTVLRFTLGQGATGSTRVQSTDGLYFDEEQDRLLIFRKGPYLVILGSPLPAPVEDLVTLGDRLQL